MCLTTEVFSPSLGSFWISASKFDDSFNLVYLLSHACVQLYLHRMQMVMHVLPETNQEGYGLLNATLLLEMDVGQF